MIGARGFDVPSQSFDISFRRPPLTDWDGRALVFGMSDAVAGPLVMLLYDAPSTPEQLAGPPDLTPAHGHPSDNLRVVMKGELIVGQDRYHPGDFRLQRTGRPYGRDGDAPHVDGNWRVIVFADRRGHILRATNKELRARLSGPEALQRIHDQFGELLPVILDDDDDGVPGLVTTLDKPFKPLGNADAAYSEAQTWPELRNGSRTIVTLMGVHDLGPIVVQQHTPAGVMATPAFTVDSDVFRCVIGGSHQRAGQQVETGDCRFQEAGTPWEAVVAGRGGLDELIVFGDRRGATPVLSGADDGGWAGHLAGVLPSLLAQLPSLELRPARAGAR
jgi:hypothetical protein